MLIVGNHYLLADAEMGEDGLEDVGSGDGTGYGAEVVDGLAHVLGDEVDGLVLVDACYGAFYRGQGLLQGLRVPGVGHGDFLTVVNLAFHAFNQ